MAKSKRQMVEDINNAFIDVLQEENAQTYVKYIKRINRELIDNIETLTPDKAKRIIQRESINIDNMALLFTIQNAILVLINQPSQKKDTMLVPIFAVMAMYSMSDPKRFAKKIIHIAKGKNLSNREKQAFKSIKQFENMNKQFIDKTQKQAVRNLNRSIDKSKVYKRMVKDYKEQRKQFGDTPIEITKSNLKRKYNGNKNIERALDTELHAQSEYIKKEHSKELGYTHKIWKTQSDGRVRETCFHQQMHNKEVLIDSDFRACGLRAEYAGDERLPPSERIRCRCYIVYR